MDGLSGKARIVALALLTKHAYGSAPFVYPSGLTGVAQIFGNPAPWIDSDGTRSRYGLIATDDAGAAYVGIRGTQTPVEWFADFEAFLVPCAFGPGNVERGFSRIYSTFELADGSSLLAYLATFPAVYVAGHSLGGPLATYLAAQARAAGLVCFASPKPGDGTFAAWARSQIGPSILYANVPDVVPHVPLTIPPLFDFEPLCALTALDSRGKVPAGLASAHEIDTYLQLVQAS